MLVRIFFGALSLGIIFNTYAMEPEEQQGSPEWCRGLMECVKYLDTQKVQKYLRSIKPDASVCDVHYHKPPWTKKVTALVYFVSYLSANPKNIDMMQILLQHGADPNSKMPNNNPVLYKTAEHNAKLVELLLDKGADPFSVDFEGHYLFFNPYLRMDSTDILCAKAKETDSRRFDRIVDEVTKNLTSDEGRNPMNPLSMMNAAFWEQK